MLEFGLEETGPATCRLELDMRYRLAGPLSQFGRPELIAEIADRLLGEVGSAIERQVRGVELDADVDISPASLNALSLLLHGFKAVISRIFGGGPK